MDKIDIITKQIWESTLRQTINEYNRAGWIAYRHPRNKTVSLNGFPPIPEKAAQQHMSTHLNEYYRNGNKH